MIQNQEAARAATEHRDPRQILVWCDGPPPKPYPRTVVFTSPNETGLRTSRKVGMKFYMPLWTLELQEAAAELEIGIDDATIKTAV
ncbi:unnamed protein product [Phytophthora lilii]|uniref:Unnamed protein product n=1 Tax=Phytophthora lilii TaxID=2077276 RepID=A0A9W6UAC6_9STRA|nr:unnamed protein product [Phytophthora lilii]